MGWNLFSRSKSKVANVAKSQYGSATEFLSDNIADVKRLLSSVGYNDKHKRLVDLASMTGCQVLLLCSKMNNIDTFKVIDCSDTSFDVIGCEFTWQHNQPAASSDAVLMLSKLPFPNISATSFISVPIKNSHNILSGILLGLSFSKIDNPDANVRLLHILAQPFDAEIECERLKAKQGQYDQRISSLNQTIEILNTDLTREREKSLESRELRSTFLTNFSQEIRTPMNAVVGFVDLLETAQTDEERMEFVGIIKQNSMLLLKVIDNLIEISKMQTSFMFKPAEPQQLNELLLNLRIQYEGKLKQSGKKIPIITSFALSTPDDTVWNSSEIITKTMDLLLDNACKFTEKGEIMIGYTTNQKEMTFFVKDTGIGIRKGEEDIIFNMFSQGEDVAGCAEGGGIGLALARKYVELLNGKIWADTDCEEGAKFCFAIPMEKL
jgi:signal transduction histidine kinase